MHYLSGLREFVLPPEGLRFPPAGTAWLDFLPVADWIFHLVLIVGMAAAVAVLVGWHARWAAWIVLAAVFYGGWVTTLTGKVDHTHHLIWIMLILAVSPCANVWAVRREQRQGSYRWPVFAVLTLIGLIYFGAGLQKVASAGFEWGWSDNLSNWMLRMAWEKNLSVHEWMLDWPIISRMLGILGLAFELLFLPLILIPTTRKWVWPAGLLFHWGTWVLLGISFLTLQLLYVVFLPWDLDLDPSPPTMIQRRLIAALIAAVAVFSLSGVETAWPVAAYPGFDGIADHRMRDFEVVTSDGSAFVTKMDQSRQVSPQRILPLTSAGLRHNPAGLAAWLGAEVVYEVTIDVSTGQVLERQVRYPVP